MTEAEKIYAASYAIGKRLDYEELRYSDLMYGKEDLTEEVWEYVEECEEIGQVDFAHKYRDYKLYYTFPVFKK